MNLCGAAEAVRTNGEGIGTPSAASSMRRMGRRVDGHRGADLAERNTL
jgi:hypothetical protein